MEAQGVLRVHVISAKGIALDPSGGLPDSSAKIFLSQQPEETHETLVQKGTASPEWGEQFDFHGTLAEIANKRLGVSAHLGVELNDGSKASLPFGNEVANGKLLEGRLNTQGTVKVFASFAPLKVLHSSVLYIKKTGLTNTRYIKCNKCTLSIAEGTLDDGTPIIKTKTITIVSGKTNKTNEKFSKSSSSSSPASSSSVVFGEIQIGYQLSSLSNFKFQLARAGARPESCVRQADRPQSWTIVI